MSIHTFLTNTIKSLQARHILNEDNLGKDLLIFVK